MLMVYEYLFPQCIFDRDTALRIGKEGNKCEIYFREKRCFSSTDTGHPL